MSTMNGIKVHVETTELREHLLQRVSYHSERADYYGRKVAMQTEEEEHNGFSNSMKQSDKGSELSHRRSAAKFKFMADHLFEGITYILDDADLHALEIGQ